MYINNHQGQDHFLGIDLIDRAQPFDEMSRRIDVSPYWPTCVNSSEKKPTPRMFGRLSYQ